MSTLYLLFGRFMRVPHQRSSICTAFIYIPGTNEKLFERQLMILLYSYSAPRNSDVHANNTTLMTSGVHFWSWVIEDCTSIITLDTSHRSITIYYIFFLFLSFSVRLYHWVRVTSDLIRWLKTHFLSVLNFWIRILKRHFRIPLPFCSK